MAIRERGFNVKAAEPWSGFMGGFGRGQNFVKSLSQDVNRRGLEQDAADTDGCGLLLVFGTYVAGGQDDRRGWADGENLARNFEAGKARHGEVGDNRSESLGIGAKFGEGGEGVDVTGNVVTEPFQKMGTESDEGFFVVDEEQVFGVEGFAALLNRRNGGGDRRGRRSGKVEEKGCALAWLAVDGNRAIVTGYDAVNDRKTKTGALSDGLGGEKRIENAIESGAIHAATIIADGDADVGSFVQARGALAIIWSEETGS